MTRNDIFLAIVLEIDHWEVVAVFWIRMNAEKHLPSRPVHRNRRQQFLHRDRLGEGLIQPQVLRIEGIWHAGGLRLRDRQRGVGRCRGVRHHLHSRGISHFDLLVVGCD
jgi:hypothetical protein